MILFKKRITKALIRLRGCAGWSALVLFPNPRRQVFSHEQSICTKIDALVAELSEFDILAFTKSKLHAGITDEGLKFENYHSPERKDRNNMVVF